MLIYKMTPLLLFFLATLSTTGRSITLPWNDDVLGLIVFKADLGNPESLSSWIEDDASPCSWAGIQCGGPNQRVVGISLDGLSISGFLGKGLLKLDQLETLSLSRNNLSGVIPPQIQVLESLKSINLAQNSLSGTIPESLGSLASLWSLDLSHNRLQGPLPVFGDKLLHLNTAFNNLSGDIPAEIGTLSRLKSLDLSHNSLSGQVPVDILQCSRLETLDVSHNMLTGLLPRLPSSLTTLLATSNSFSGGIPDWLANLTRLTDLNLGLNNLRGPISATTFASLASLERLYIFENSLDGDIPAAEMVSSCTNLSDIDLSGNRLTGPVPSPFFQGLDHLFNLGLSGNNLTGGLPEISSCKSLQSLDLSKNMLQDELQLQFLGQCTELASLNLAGNSFRGNIPAEMPTALNNLHLLDLSDNQLTGFVPASFENATSLTGLFLHGNMLHGAIPVELGSCQSLAYLDLSFNNFSGGIPVELSDLVKLQVLDLSNNHLSGQIPASFGDLNNLTTFNVSHNSLAGPLPVDGVFQQLDASSFEGNLHLCGAPLKLKCPAIPKPIVLDPNAPGSPMIINGGSSKNKTRSNKNRIVLSVSAIVAISAAAVIALGIVVVSLLNLGKQQHRAKTQRPRSSFYVVDSSLPPGSSPSEDVAIGKLVMFTDDSTIDDDDTSTNNDDLLPQAQALLNKDSELGRGSFGTVYRATLAAGRVVAVKKLTVAGLVQSQHEFEKRVQFLGRIQHPNLVNFQGYYWTPKLQLLIYDFVACGSLHSRLHEQHRQFPWEDRLRVALGAASALVYLHHKCKPRVIHANFKSANILLDDHGNARVSDYGLIKLLPSPRRRHEVTSKQQLGYMPPECSINSSSSASAAASFKATDKSDVYAFGVMLLELVTGRMPLEYTEDDLLLVSDLCRCAVDHGRPFDCLDPRLGGYPEDEVLTVMKLGLVCTSHTPSNRPTMAQVMQILELIKPLAPPGSGGSASSS